MKNRIKYIAAGAILINFCTHAQTTIPGLHKVLSVIPQNISAKLQNSASSAPQIAINALEKTTKNTLIVACATAGLVGGSYLFSAPSAIAEQFNDQFKQQKRFSKTTRHKLTNTPATITLTGATIGLSRYSSTNPYVHAGALGALCALSFHTSVSRIKTIKDYTGLENRHALAALNFALAGALSIAPAHNNCSLVTTAGDFLGTATTIYKFLD